MINRRAFLKSLGAALVGTGVAYSFPSVIVPNNIDKAIVVADEFGALTFAKLNAAYNQLKNRMGCEPDVIVVNKNVYDYINAELIPGYARFRIEGHEDFGYGHLKFQGTIIEPSDCVEDKRLYGSYGMRGVVNGVVYRDLSIYEEL